MSGNDIFDTTAREYQEMIKDIGTKEVEWKVDGLETVSKDGYLYFGPSTPSQSLAEVMKETLPTEFLRLQDPECYIKVLSGEYMIQDFVWLLFDQTGMPVERPHTLPGFMLRVFGSEQEAMLYGQMMGLITPEMLMPVPDPMTGEVMPPQLPVQSVGNRWRRLLNLTHYKGRGPFVFETQRFRRDWGLWGKQQEKAAIL